VIFSRYLNIFGPMQRPITILCAMMLVAASPSLVFASGSAGTVPASATRQSAQRSDSIKAQAASTNSSQEPTVDEDSYNVGKALFSGKYRFGNPTLTDGNVAEKLQRLVTLRRTLPAAERGKLNPPELARRLTHREMNALEYYIGMRFGKFITRSPSWAKVEPPPKIVLAK
jgi:hypothetical protein